MRIAVMTAVAIALLTMPAQAQTMTPGQSPWGTLPKVDKSTTGDEHPATKADEKAYKSSLDKIPDPKQAYDPWRNMRGTTQSNNSR